MTDHQDILAFPPSRDAGSPSEPDRDLTTEQYEGRNADQATLKFPQTAASQGSAQGGVCRQPFTWQDLRPEPSSLSVVVRLGKKRMRKSDVAQLGQGDIVTLDRPTDDWVEVVVDSQVVAIGRMVVAQGKIAIEIDRVHQLARRRSA